jgi:hypothetical protein
MIVIRNSSNLLEGGLTTNSQIHTCTSATLRSLASLVGKSEQQDGRSHDLPSSVDDTVSHLLVHPTFSIS